MIFKNLKQLETCRPARPARPARLKAGRAGRAGRAVQGKSKGQGQKMTTTACLALMQPSCIKLQPFPKWLQAIGGKS